MMFLAFLSWLAGIHNQHGVGNAGSWRNNAEKGGAAVRAADFGWAVEGDTSMINTSTTSLSQTKIT
jgi:hypothetical protein